MGTHESERWAIFSVIRELFITRHCLTLNVCGVDINCWLSCCIYNLEDYQPQE
jgi:hypothetical protein